MKKINKKKVLKWQPIATDNGFMFQSLTREEGRWLKGHFLMNSSGMAENSRKLFLCLIDLAMEKGDEERANGKSDTN
jgi:hypothetical protein